MSVLMKAISSFFGYAILAIAAQNALLARGLGISNGIRIINDPKKNTLHFCISLAVFQMLTSVSVYMVLPLIDNTIFAPYRRFVLPTIIVICCALSYILVVVILSIILSKSEFREVIFSVTSASINSAVVGTVLIGVTQGFTLLESLGFGIGSSFGYFLAMILVVEGERKIAHDKVPSSFQGLPITLIYIAVLALAVYGLTGHMVSL